MEAFSSSATGRVALTRMKKKSQFQYSDHWILMLDNNLDWRHRWLGPLSIGLTPVDRKLRLGVPVSSVSWCMIRVI